MKKTHANPTESACAEAQRRHWMSVLDFGVLDGVPAAPPRNRPVTSEFIAMP